MKKALFAATVVTVALIAVSSAALAFGGGYGPGGSGECLMDALNEEQRAQLEETIGEYRQEMAKLREKMREMKDENNYEAFRKAQEERYELMKQKHETLREILPGEYSERFESCGRNMRNHGWDKGRGGFKSQQRGDR